VGGRGAR
jgi:hypothetical protein